MEEIRNAITRESMDDLIDSIIGIVNCDWLSEESKPAEIERMLVDGGIVTVIEDQTNNINKFQIEVDTGFGGYGCTDTLEELLEDVEMECSEEEIEVISAWAKSSKDGDEYISENKRIHIWNVGN